MGFLGIPGQNIESVVFLPAWKKSPEVDQLDAQIFSFWIYPLYGIHKILVLLGSSAEFFVWGCPAQLSPL